MASLTTARAAVVPGGSRAASAAARVVAVTTVIEMMTDQPDRPLALDDMGRATHLSPWYFNRVFREITGLPPRRFQTALRMAAAKRLLLTSALSVSDVCLEVGYRSLGTFVTHFRELVGVSPGTLRGLADVPLPPVPAAGDPQSGGAWRGATATVAGSLSASDDVPRVIFLGLFAYPCPQGVPRACAILGGPGAFRIGAVPPGRHHLAAAALPRSGDPQSYLLPEDADVLVATGGPGVTARPGATEVRHLRLRPKRATDPPLLLVPSALMPA